MLQGYCKKKKGTISCPIERDADSIIKRTVSPHGKRAITHYQVKEELNNASLVEVSLETGRTHQIRVHFSAVGHPLIGDDLYGGRNNDIGTSSTSLSSISI
ncbi:pseudouridine synthase [Gracilibacillus boraciitolerans]|uniref:pseudouridine synthase n=1 Tax=Gracilibacillus boraciitolerans TaxID=307521 RepID=UPI003F710697